MPDSPYSHLFTDLSYFTTHDGLTLRYGMFPASLRNRNGSLVLLHGRTEFLEKYGETIAKFQARGLDVYSLDWRGQGRSSRMLKDPQKGHITDYKQYTRDLNAFMTRICRKRALRPIFLVSHSMGGNIGIQYLHDFPGQIDKAVFCCPFFDFALPPVTKLMFLILSKAACGLGMGHAYVPGRGPWRPSCFDENVLTGDPARYAHDTALAEADPTLRIGGPTLAWAVASARAIARIRQPDFLSRIQVPILILSGTSDTAVSIPAQQKIAQRLPNAEMVSIPNGRHELLRETDAIQKIIWGHLDRFLHL